MEISPATWLWRGLRGRSVTFALLFASFVLGVSIAGGVGRLLGSLGVHWLYVMILPAVLYAWLNRNEQRWIPDEKKRRLWSLGLIFGSALLAIVINQIKH